MSAAPARLRQCPHCQRPFVLCPSCAGGHRYCSHDCARAARRDALRRAGQRYQRSLPGRRRHADRQARYRARRRSNVTHHRSLPPADAATVASTDAAASASALATASPLEVPDAHSPRVVPSASPDATTTMPLALPAAFSFTRCAICGRPCDPWLRLPSRALAARRPRPP